MRKFKKALITGISGSGGSFLAEYILKIVPEGTHQYRKFIKPSELLKMLEKSDFKINDIKGVKLNPIDYSFSLSSITKINYLIFLYKKISSLLNIY